MVGYEILAQRKEAAHSGKSFRNLVLIGVLLVAAWFFCVAPAMRWFQREGVSMGDLVPTSAPRLSQAQIEATEQAEIAQRTAAFEDIEVRVGDVTNFRKGDHRPYVGGLSYQEDIFFTVTVLVENKGTAPHEVLLCTEVEEEGVSYLTLEVAPRSQATFEFEVSGFAQSPIPSYHGVSIGEELNVRLESVDGVLRENTPWDGRFWDSELGLVSVDDYDRYLPDSK